MNISFTKILKIENPEFLFYFLAHYDGHRYEYKYQQYLPYAINARKFGKAYDDISAIVHHYGLEIPKSSVSP